MSDKAQRAEVHGSAIDGTTGDRHGFGGQQSHGAAGRSSPGLRYRNVQAAIDWLSQAFGFEVRSLQNDDNGTAAYAELSFGSTIIMVGGVSGFDIDRYMKQPDDIGGAETQCCYYVVDDLDALYVRARRAGCEIVIDLTTRPNGARDFTCRDPEGHLWCFGTYDPYLADGVAEAHGEVATQRGQKEAQGADKATDPERPDARAVIAARAFGVSIAPDRVRSARGRTSDMDMEALAGAAGNAFTSVTRFSFPARLAASLSIAAVVSGTVAAWIYADAWQTSRRAVAGPAALIGPERMIGTELSSEMFQQAIKDARRRLALEHRQRRAAEKASHLARAAAQHERELRLAAEEAAKQLAAELETARTTAERAQSAAALAQDNLAQQQAATPEERQRLVQALQSAQQTAATARDALGQAQRAAADAEAKRADAERAQADAERQKAEAEHATVEAERGKADALQAKQLAEEQRAAAQRELKETHARLTFVSLNAKEGSAEAVAELRQQVATEKSAREAAEEEAKDARAELARERRLKADAWQTVNVLRRRLAALGVSTQTAPAKPAAARRKAAVATQQEPQPAAPSKGPAGDGGWSLYSGPHFVKQD